MEIPPSLNVIQIGMKPMSDASETGANVPGQPQGIPSGFREAFHRILAGNPGGKDIDLVRHVLEGRGVRIDGNANGAMIVTGDGNIVISNADPEAVRVLVERLFPPHLHQLRPPSKVFTGRSLQLQKILEAREQGGATITGLRGLGGIGKTALALVAADRMKADYPDAQILLDLRGTSPDPVPPEELLARVIRAFHPGARLPESMDELVPLYHSTLHGKRVLILADNAAGADQVRHLVPTEGSCLLITSRFRFHLTGWQPIDVSELEPEEAQTLLRALAPRLTEQQAVDLAHACGCLPLALALAGGALCAREEIQPDAYVVSLNQNGERLRHLDKHMHQTDEELGMAASLSLSFELLPTELGKFWCALSVFPAGFDDAAAGAVIGTAKDMALERLGDLWCCGLVESEKQGRYRLHDLARDFATAQSSKQECSTLATLHAQHYLKVLNHANDLYLQGGYQVEAALALFDMERINFDAGQAWAAEKTKEDRQAASLAKDYPSGWDLLDLRLHPKSHIQWLEAALQAARLLKDRHSEGIHLGNLGQAYIKLGELQQAIDHIMQGLAIDEEIGDIHGKMVDLSNLGIAHIALGEVRKAIVFAEKALSIAETINSSKEIGQNLRNLGIAYRTLNEYKKALGYYTRALAVAQRQGNPREEASVLRAVGNVHFCMGDMEEALSHSTRALEMDRKLGDSRGECGDLIAIGLVYANQDKFQDAITNFQAAITISRVNNDRQAEAGALNNLGLVLRGENNFEQAMDCFDKSIQIARQIRDKHGEASALGDRGLAKLRIGEARPAISDFEKQLVLSLQLEDLRGQGHASFNTALAWMHLQEPHRAIPWAERALTLLREIESPHADQVARALSEWR